MFTSRHRAVAALIAVLVVLPLSGCANRSVEAYCSTFFTEGKKFRAQYATTSAEPGLGDLVKLLAAPQELATFFGKLDKVAPDDIEPDIAVVRDSFQKQSDSMGDTASNPLGGLFKNLMTGITSAPAFERVDTYTTKNCGQPPPD